MKEKERILVLKTIKTSGMHLVVYGLNSQGARMHLWAPSALKSQRRFSAGALNPTHLTEILYKKAKNAGGLDILEEGTLLQSFPGLNKSYQRMRLALYFLSLILKVSQRGVLEQFSLFDLLKKALKATESYSPLFKLKFYFEAKLLEHEGVLPSHLSMEKVKTYIKEGEMEHQKHFLDLKHELETALSFYISKS